MAGIYLKSMDSIRLPEPIEHRFFLEDALKKRRSLREYSGKEVSIQELSNLLYAAQGITDTVNNFRASPSAGALYPLTIYILWNDALWRYEPETHTIYKIRNDRKLKKELYMACLLQEWVLNAPVVFVFAADYQKTAVKYGKRAWRYIYMEVGHACQNLLLEAVALGMGGVPVGAFEDGKLQKILSVPETPVYVVPAGHKP